MTIPSVLDFITAAQPPWEPEPATPTSISGTATVGATLTCVAPTWAGTPPGSVTFDWQTPRSGAGGPTYLVQPHGAGDAIRCRTAARIGGGGTVYFLSPPVTIA